MLCLEVVLEPVSCEHLELQAVGLEKPAQPKRDRYTEDNEAEIGCLQSEDEDDVPCRDKAGSDCAGNADESAFAHLGEVLRLVLADIFMDSNG